MKSASKFRQAGRLLLREPQRGLRTVILDRSPQPDQRPEFLQDQWRANSR